MVKCPICKEEIGFLEIEEIPLDVNGEEYRLGSYQGRLKGSQNQKFREEEVYGCQNGCTRMSKKEFLELKKSEREGP